MNKQAQLKDMYIGLYVYNDYWQTWANVLGFGKTDEGRRWGWIVQEVDLDGNPIGEVRQHCTPVWACFFADKPFNPTYKDISIAKYGRIL